MIEYEQVTDTRRRKLIMGEYISREDAFTLLRKYNQDHFHIHHALTVEGVMKWFANELGYGDDAEYWGIVGLLHDIDFEQYPEEHCIKAPELLRDAGVGEDIIHAVCSHGYGSEIRKEEIQKQQFCCRMFQRSNTEGSGYAWMGTQRIDSKDHLCNAFL